MFSYIYFPWLCDWEGCITVLVAHGQRLASVMMHPNQHYRPHPTPFMGKSKREGVEWYPVLHLILVRKGSQDWFEVLPLLSFRWFLDRLDFISSDSMQSMLRALCRIHNGLKVVFCFMYVTPSHYHPVDFLTCIEHIRWKIPKSCVNACWVFSVGGVSKMYLILSVTLYTSQYV